MKLIALFDFGKGKVDLSNVKAYYFDSSVKIEHDVSSKKLFSILIDENPNYIKNFYAKNIDSLSICVGQNGSGKTRLLNNLVDICNNNFSNNDEKYLVIIKEKGFFRWSSNLNEDISIEIILDTKNIKKKKCQNFGINKIVHISNSIEPNHKNKNYTNYLDYSMTGKLKKDNYLNISNNSANNQLKFVFSDIVKDPKRSIISKFDINSIINFENIHFDDEYHKYFNSSSLTYNMIDKKLNDLSKSKNNSLGNVKYLLSKNFFFNQIKKDYEYENLNFYTKFRDNFLDKCELKKTNIYKPNNIMKLHKYFKEYIKDSFSNVIDSNEMERFDIFISSLENNSDLSKKNIEISISKLVNKSEKVTEINKEFIDSDIFRELKIYWNSISSGANALLTIFTDLSNGINQLDNDDNNDFLILMDEVDIALHPNWQKSFLINIFEFIENNFRKKNIQIILTTHSPLILSDLRKDDVNFIGSNNSNIDFMTFGANLNELMAESFFLSDGLMGDYSKSVIKKVIKNINSEKELSQVEVNKIFKIIDEIGEIFIKKSLIKNMESLGYYRINENIKDRQQYLKNELKKINEELDEINKNYSDGIIK